MPSTDLVRMKFGAVAAKIETVPGLDAFGGSPPALSDFIGGDFSVTFDQSTVQDPTLTGSLDKAPDIVGGLRPNLTLRVPLRGPAIGSPLGTAPEWAKLLRACAMAETAVASVVGAPTAALNTSTNTAAALQAPFAASAQLYRGMPILLSGDRTGVDVVVDYTAGRVASLARTYGTAIGTGTLFQIPVHTLYSPTSDEAVFKNLTIYGYRDGLRWRFVGALGTASLSLPTGGIAMLEFQMRAVLVAAGESVAMPSGWNAIQRPTPPRFVNGMCQLDRQLAQARTVSYALGITTQLPDNPEALDGYDPAIPTERAVTGSLDPLMNTTSYAALFGKFQGGTNMPLATILGTTPGNRFSVVVPQARATQNNPGERDGQGVNNVNFAADGPDASFFLASF